MRHKATPWAISFLVYLGPQLTAGAMSSAAIARSIGIGPLALTTRSTDW
jgi:hypothetical protein